MLGEIQYLSLASFCLSHWVPLEITVLPIPFSRDESFSHALRTLAPRDENWFTLMYPDSYSITFLQKLLF